MTTNTSPAQFDELPSDYDAVLLLGFGGPEGQDDVIPFLRNVTRGRGIPDNRLEEVAHHYRHFDGLSPINEQNRQLQVALQAELDRREIALPVLWGNRNWAPYLTDVMRAAAAQGHERLLVLPTSAFASYSGCRQYQENIAQALDTLAEEQTSAGNQAVSGARPAALVVDKLRPYFDHPAFIAPWITATKASIAELLEREPTLDLTRDVRVVFTTHSVPTSYSGAFGPDHEHLGGQGAYEAQHLAAAAEIAAAACPDVKWQLAYQSRSGPPTQPWLEPDINDAIAELPAQGVRAVVIVPVGFVSDHMEVLWDLDTEALDTCAELGLAAVRVPTPGTDPVYVSGLIDLVLERRDGVAVADRPSLTTLGPWFDVCGVGCCETPARVAEADVRLKRAAAVAAATRNESPRHLTLVSEIAE